MLFFDAANPFPHVDEEVVTYPEAQAHSAEVDRWLGLDTERIEAALGAKCPEGQEHWLGLPVRALLTPYTELRSLLERLGPRPGDTLVDLGAGYGRMGFVIARHFPGVSFIGYECVTERVQEASRCLKGAGADSRARMEIADLSDPHFLPVAAPYYFIYDFGSVSAIEKTLGDLRVVARLHPIAVVGRGRRIRDAIERGHPWLSAIRKPEHFKHSSIYRSTSG